MFELTWGSFQIGLLIAAWLWPIWRALRFKQLGEGGHPAACGWLLVVYTAGLGSLAYFFHINQPMPLVGALPILGLVFVASAVLGELMKRWKF